MKYIVAIIFGLPAAILLGVDAALAFGAGERGGQAFLIAFLLCWPIVAFWSARADSGKQAFGRSSLCYAITAFLLPIAAISFTVVVGNELVEESEGDIETAATVGFIGLAGAVLLVVSFVFGLFSGAIGLALAYFTTRDR